MDVEADVRQSQAKTEKTVEGGVGGKALFVVRGGGREKDWKARERRRPVNQRAGCELRDGWDCSHPRCLLPYLDIGYHVPRVSIGAY